MLQYKSLLQKILLIFLGLTAGFVAGRLLHPKKQNFSMVEIPQDYPQPKKVKLRTPGETWIVVKNAEFQLAKNIHMLVSNLRGSVLPINGAEIVNFDDIFSYAIDIFEGKVLIPTSTLEHIFNDYVMNYEGAPLKEQKIHIREKDGKRELVVEGKMKFMSAWIPYEMTGKLSVDPKTNLFVLEAKKIKSLGNPMTKQIMSFFGLSLDKLIKIPENRGVTIRGNNVVIRPFQIMPPPRTGGYVQKILLSQNGIILVFQKKYKLPPFHLPKSDAKNYMYLYGGQLKFGRFIMTNADLQMIDLSPENPFVFNAKGYKKTLTNGYSKILSDGRVLAFLPDYKD